MTDELKLSLLGQLHISRGETPLTGFISSKVPALLCYLAVTGRPHDRQSLATLLWGEMPETEAKANLRTVLFNLRKLVGDHVIVTRQVVAFNQERAYWLDVEQFIRTLNRAGIAENEAPGKSYASSPDGQIPGLTQVVELYQGDFLPSLTVREAPVFEEWLLGQRERLRRLAIQALYHLVSHHAEREEYVAAIDYATRLLALEPWHEETHRQLMQVLARSGQVQAALAQYETCRQALMTELGLEPGAATTELYQRLAGSGTAAPHNLPPQSTPFLGRETELAQIKEALNNAACRLLTLVGPGGVGKTRLALQAGAEQIHSPAFPDGIFFVSLASVRSPDQIISSLLDALPFSLSGPLEPKRQLLGYLAAKELLLILDNYEQLLAFSAVTATIDLLTEILQTAPQVKLLVTSRERLNLLEEWVLEIAGLAYPTSDSPWQESQSYNAVNFFVEQACRVQPGFILTEINQKDVVHLCQLVDGTPLGLELAATWLPVLSCAEITAEIAKDLDFLASSLRNMPDRHRSMRAVFESSWNLLSEKEQQVLQGLTVFHGGFQREAAIEVTGANLSILLSLMNKSLLRRNATGRYDMHDLIHQYAAEKLAQQPLEQEKIRDRHSRYYAEFMHRHEQALYSSRQAEIIQLIRTEFKNIQAAWQRALEYRQLELVAKCVWGLWFYCSTQGWFYEGVELFARGLEVLAKAPPGDEQQRIYALLLGCQADMYYCLTYFGPAEELSHQGLALLEPLHAPREKGFIWQTLGLVAWHQGDYRQAGDYLNESISYAMVSGDTWGYATSTSLLGAVAYALGDYPRAEQLLRQSLPLLRKTDRLWGLTMTLIRLSSVVSAQGRSDEAQRLLEEGLVISREMGDRWGIASCLSRLGLELNRLGDTTGPDRLKAVPPASASRRQKAKQLLQESIGLFREIGENWGLAKALDRLGQTNLALGEPALAGQQLQEALQIASDNQLTPVTLDILMSLAELRLQLAPTSAALTGEKTVVLELLTLILNHPASQQPTKDRAARLLSQIEAHLPRPVIDLALTRYRTSTLEAVVAKIL